MMETRSEPIQNVGSALLPLCILEAMLSAEDRKITKVLFPSESRIYRGDTDMKCFSCDSRHRRGPGKVQLAPQI